MIKINYDWPLWKSNTENCKSCGQTDTRSQIKGGFMLMDSKNKGEGVHGGSKENF